MLDSKPMEDIQIENFLVSLFFSAVGLAYLTFGKKNGRIMFMLFGLMIMAVGYFIESFWLNLTISTALSITLLLLKNRF